MIENSEVYEGRRSTGSSSRTYSRQEAFWQSAYFSEFSWQELSLEPTVIEESFSIPIFREDNSNSTFATENNTSKNFNHFQNSQNRSLKLLDDVSLDLLAIPAQEATIDTVSTEIETELMVQSSLYDQELTESELSILVA